jgi:hypothetical protein
VPRQYPAAKGVRLTKEAMDKSRPMETKIAQADAAK